MSWVFGFVKCPKCGESDWHVDKTQELKDQGLMCTSPVGCGHDLGKGSYWITVEGGYEQHRKNLGWDKKPSAVEAVERLCAVSVHKVF